MLWPRSAVAVKTPLCPLNTSAFATAFACLAITASAAELDFYRDVFPFLKSNCVSCHNKTTTKADLNMETPELMIKGGESGPAIVPGKSKESLIVVASRHLKDMEMPPPNNKSGASNLTPAEIAILARWIDEGAQTSVQEERVVVWQPMSASVDPIYTLAMTKAGRYAACGRANQLFVYDLATRQLVTQVTDPAVKQNAAHRAMVQSLAFSPDGTRLASGSFREVKVWRLDQTKASTGKGKQILAASPSSPAPISDKLAKQIASLAKATITSHAWSADNKRLATACSDGVVRVWDAADGKLVSELKGSFELNQQISALEGTIAAQTLEQTFQKAEIARIEAQTKALDELLKKANDAITSMTKALPEKQKAVKPAQDATAAAQKIVNDVKEQVAKAGKADAALEKQLKDAQDKLLTATMSERSTTSAVSATESNVKDAQADVKRITDAKAKNTKDIATANASIDAAKKLADKGGADLAAAKQSISKPKAKPVAIAFSADAQRVATMFDDGMLHVFAVASATAVEQIKGSAATSATISAQANGSFIATEADGSALTTSSTPRWVLERTIGGEKARALFADRVNAVRFSPDGKTLATGGGELSRSGDIALFDVASGKLNAKWKERHDDTVLCLDFSPDGKLLASGAADKIAKVTEVATGRQKNLFEGHTHHVTSIAFRSDGRVLATAGADGVVSAWDMIIGERKKKIEGWTKEVTSLQFIGATNQIVTSAGDNKVRIVTDEGSEIRTIGNLPDYMQASVSTPDGTMLVAGGEDSVLRVWDGTNGKELAVFGAK